MEKSKNRFVALAFDKVDIYCSFVICMLLFICSPHYNIIFRGIFWWLSMAWGLCIFVYHAAFKKDVPWKNPFFLIAFVYSLAINLTCLAHGAFARYGLGYLFNAFFLLACFFPFEHEKETLKKAFPIAIASSCLYSIIDMIIFARTGQSFSFRETRHFGIWGNPNSAGMFVSSVLMFAFYLFLNTAKLKYKLLLIISAIILMMELLLTGCRSALLGLVVAVAVIFFCYCARCYATGTVHQKKLLSIILVILLICVVIFCMSPIGKKVFNKVISSGTSGRTPIWQAGLHYAPKHLLFGDNQVEIMKKAGEATVEIGFSESEIASISAMDPDASFHNGFIHTLLVGGLFTFIPYVLLILSFYVEGFKCLVKIKKMDIEEFNVCVFYASLFSLILFITLFESVVSFLSVVPVAYYFAYALGTKTFSEIEKKYR